MQGVLKQRETWREKRRSEEVSEGVRRSVHSASHSTRLLSLTHVLLIASNNFCASGCTPIPVVILS